MANKTKKPAVSKAEIAAEVQAITGYSVSHIIKVMAGTRSNTEITKAVKQVRKTLK